MRRTLGGVNVDNEPQTDFEKQAANALRAAGQEFERVEKGTYYRAGAVPLRGGCLKCHVSRLTQEVGKQPVTGLVISMPVEAK